MNKKKPYFFSEYGPAIIDHVLLEQGLSGNLRLINDPGGKGFNIERDFTTLENAIQQAEELLQSGKTNTAKVTCNTYVDLQCQ